MDPAVSSLATGLVGGIGSLALGIGNSINQSNIAKQNLQFQKDVFNYQKQLQREIFQREDSSIQRRATDIAAAGGNPAMAWETGTGAQGGTPVGVQAPQEQAVDFGNLAESSLAQFTGGIQQFMEMQFKEQQIKNLSSNTSKTDAETITESIRQFNLMAEEAKTYEEAAYYKALAKKEAYNLDYSISKDLRTTDNNVTMYNTVKDFVNTFIPSNIENINLSEKDLIQIAMDVGLFAVPGLAGVKVAKLGAKALKGALSIFRKSGGKLTINSFKQTFYKLTGRLPSKSEVEKFKSGIKQNVHHSTLYNNFK